MRIKLIIFFLALVILSCSNRFDKYTSPVPLVLKASGNKSVFNDYGEYLKDRTQHINLVLELMASFQRSKSGYTASLYFLTHYNYVT